MQTLLVRQRQSTITDAEPDQQIIIYTAEPGSPSEQALAAWAAETFDPPFMGRSRRDAGQRADNRVVKAHRCQLGHKGALRSVWFQQIAEGAANASRSGPVRPPAGHRLLSGDLTLPTTKPFTAPRFGCSLGKL